MKGALLPSEGLKQAHGNRGMVLADHKGHQNRSKASCRYLKQNSPSASLRERPRPQAGRHKRRVSAAPSYHTYRLFDWPAYHLLGLARIVLNAGARGRLSCRVWGSVSNPQDSKVHFNGI